MGATQFRCFLLFLALGLLGLVSGCKRSDQSPQAIETRADFLSPEGAVLSSAKDGYGLEYWNGLSVLSIKTSKWVGRKKGNERALSLKAVDVIAKADWKNKKFNDDSQLLFVVDEIDGRWRIDSMWLVDAKGKEITP